MKSKVKKKKITPMKAALDVIHRSFVAHEKWLAKIESEACRHYEAEKGYKVKPTDAFQWLVRDVFCDDAPGMEAVTNQCVDSLMRIHMVKAKPPSTKPVLFDTLVEAGWTPPA
jgi:hypothetical protein